MIKSVGFADLGVDLVDGPAGVVEGWRLEDDPAGARDTGNGEDPEEEAVQHHSHVFPVLYHL